MSVSEKLLRLAEVKASIRAAIIAKGVSVSAADSFASYAAKIAAISGSGGGDPGGEEPGDYTYQLYTYGYGGLTPGATSGSMPARPIYAPYGSWRSDFKIEGGQLYVKNESGSSYTLLDANTGWTDVTGYLSLTYAENEFSSAGLGIMDGKLYHLTRSSVQRVGETTGWTRVVGLMRGDAIIVRNLTKIPMYNIYGLKNGHVYAYIGLADTVGTMVEIGINNCTEIDAAIARFGVSSGFCYAVSDGSLFRVSKPNYGTEDMSVTQVGTLTNWTMVCADIEKGICGGELKSLPFGSQIGTHSDYIDLSPTLYIRGTDLYEEFNDVLIDDTREWIAVWGNTALCRIPVT